MTESDVRSSLLAFDPLWNELFPAEQSRIISLLVERVDVRTDRVDIKLRIDGVTSLLGELTGNSVTQQDACMTTGAQAYARTVQTSAPPREIEAQALLKAARQLQDVQTNWAGMDQRVQQALQFNRQLWAIFMSAAQNSENQQPVEVRQQIANIGIFVMNQTIDIQITPEPAKLNSLIEINRNIAAGLSGRAA